LSTALQFWSEGATVIATDINEEKLKEEFQGKTGIKMFYHFNYACHICSGVIYRKMDVLDQCAIERMAEEFPQVDVLFNCAG